MPVSFDVSREESLLIDKIARRGVLFAAERGSRVKFMDLCMDICAAHANGNPLRLQELLDADDVNFGHDVFGIRRYIDRNTGKLVDCFVPRFSARSEE